jgi:S-adenosylmethionine uptake transporter
MQSLWMLLASLMFAAMGACIKVSADLGASLPHVVLLRGIPSVLFIGAWAISTRRRLRPQSWKLHIYRNLAGVSSMWMGFFAISHLPLPTAISLNYTAPLFIAGWMLVRGGSQRDPVRIVAVLAGFLGVLAVLRPSISNEHVLAASIGLAAGATSALAMMQIRQLGRSGESEWRTVLIFSCFVCITGAAGFGLQGWQPLGLQAWIMLVGVGVFGLVGQLAMTRAFGQGSALLTAALQYTTIIFAAVLGIVFWHDVPDIIAWAGMGFIIASGLLSTWRTYSEHRIMKGEAARPAVEANATAASVSAPAATASTET